MKKPILLGALLLMAAISGSAQSTNSTNASTVGSAATNDPNAIGNDRIGRGKIAGSKPKSSGATVDGSNGSATNDGASGQSGAPAPLPTASSQSGQSSRSQKINKTTSKVSRRSGVADRKQ